MSVPFKALKVGQRYLFTNAVTRGFEEGVLLEKRERGEGDPLSGRGRGEEELVISFSSVGERTDPYSRYTIKSLEPEAREPEAREPIREREKDKREEREGSLKKIGSGRKRKTRKGKKSRKTLKKTQSRKHRKRGGANCSGI